MTNVENNTVSIINNATKSVTATVNVGIAPSGVAVIPNGKKISVANSDDNTVSVIDTGTNTNVATVTVGNHPLAVSATTNGTMIHVTNLDGTISAIKTVNDKSTYTL